MMTHGSSYGMIQAEKTDSLLLLLHATEFDHGEVRER
jgi:hypothetical protein